LPNQKTGPFADRRTRGRDESPNGMPLQRSRPLTRWYRPQQGANLWSSPRRADPRAAFAAPGPLLRKQKPKPGRSATPMDRTRQIMKLAIHQTEPDSRRKQADLTDVSPSHPTRHPSKGWYFKWSSRIRFFRPACTDSLSPTLSDEVRLVA